MNEERDLRTEKQIKTIEHLNKEIRTKRKIDKGINLREDAKIPFRTDLEKDQV